jgi:DNA polymerase III subunit epsilon
MIENILVLDTETSGLSPDKHKIIELAVVLYNLKHKTILQCFSTLFPCDENPVEDINGIKPDATKCTMAEMYWPHLADMIYYTDVIVAHNAQFDKGFVKQLDQVNWQCKPWLCTKLDFVWPVDLPRRRLLDICQAMGVEYKGAHRALSDCLLMVECFNKIEDLQERFDSAMEKIIK